MNVINVKFKALVVDDNEVNILIMTNMLKAFGFDADHAESGKQAIFMAQNHTYDLIFVDHIMPNMNGIETVTELRRLCLDTNRPVIIALTSIIGDAIRSYYRKAGANTVYQKPLETTQLTEILRCWFPEYTILRDDFIKSETEDWEEQFIENLSDELEEIRKDRTGKKLSTDGYMDILEVSLKDMRRIIGHLSVSANDRLPETIQFAMHSLVGVFSQINAKKLLEEAKSMEKASIEMDIEDIQLHYARFMKRIGTFQEKLNLTMENYHANQIRKEQNCDQQVVHPMEKSEYEQCILKTIYYIKRFEFDAIIQELKKLITSGEKEYRKEFEEALMEIKEYNYQKALDQLLGIKNKIGI